MTRQKETHRRPINEWQIDRLRLTAFPATATPLEEPGWWSAVVGEPAETKIIRVKENMLREEGPSCGGTLVNQIQPNRVDWLLLPARGREPLARGFPTIGSFSDLLDPFVELMLQWLQYETCPAIQRLAFGAVLLLPVESRVAGYRQISAYLPFVTLDPEGSSDFVYQINRPRDSTSGIADLTVNRLSKWAIAAYQAQTLDLLASRPLLDSSINFRHGEVIFACSLELDINTTASLKKSLPQEKLAQVFEELVNLGKEIASEGDVR